MPRTLKQNIQRVIATLTGRPPWGNPYGIIAEFETTGALLEAARAVRRAGYRDFDVHTPFPVHGMDRAMGQGPSLVPWIVLGGGLTGCLAGLALQIWINAFEYPLVISGKPNLSLPAFIPVTFELTILFSAFGAIGAMLLTNFLPMFHHPLFNAECFSRVTTDGLFISIEASDEQFDQEKTRRFLESIGGANITLVEAPDEDEPLVSQPENRNTSA